jgi:hypothetical protein
MSMTNEEREGFRASRAILQSKIQNDVVAADSLIVQGRMLQHEKKDLHGAVEKYEAALLLLKGDKEASWIMLQKKRDKEQMVLRDLDLILSAIANWLE